MTQPQTVRARCPHCFRALRSCICALVHTVPHQVQLLILMHPQEVNEAKGTGHLLHLCLPHSRLMVGEAFDADLLNAALHGAWDDETDKPRHSLLLYPETAQQDAALGLLTAASLPEPWPCPLQDRHSLRLVVLDGTWRKSRKMLYQNAALQALPRLALQNVPDSQYRIRKAHLPGQLSTFEAATQALAQLEGWGPQSPPLQTLSQVFKQLIDSLQPQFGQ